MMHCGTLLQLSKRKGGRTTIEDDIFDSCHLPQIPDMPMAGSGHGHRVTLRSPVMRTGSVSSTPHLVPQPVSFNLSEFPDTETSCKDTDSKAEGMPNIGSIPSLTPHPQKMRRARQDTSVMMYSLKLVGEEFTKICEPNI